MLKVKTLEEGKALLAEYKALPDLDARLNWNGYDRLPDYKSTCACGYSKTYPMGLDDLERIIEKGWEWKFEYHKEKCLGHDEPDEDEEEDEEEPDEEVG